MSLPRSQRVAAWGVAIAALAGWIYYDRTHPKQMAEDEVKKWNAEVVKAHADRSKSAAKE